MPRRSCGARRVHKNPAHEAPPRPTPAGIFINYRRQDSLHQARAIYERLRADFGQGQVFIDLEGLDCGEVFKKSLARQLQDSQVLLALIGPGCGGEPRWAPPIRRSAL